MFLPAYYASGSREAIQSAAEAGSKANRAANETMQLRREVNRLLMITEALWEIVRDREGLTDDDLVRRINEIDLRDGALDGRKSTAPPADCGECGRTLPKRQPVCIYCGATSGSRDPFAI